MECAQRSQEALTTAARRAILDVVLLSLAPWFADRSAFRCPSADFSADIITSEGFYLVVARARRPLVRTKSSTRETLRLKIAPNFGIDDIR